MAIREAGANRFRPIMLTSLTTFFGLVPLMLDDSFEAAFLVPMAVSLAFGVLFATFITLMLVPTAYMILEDVQAVWPFALQRETGSRPDRPLVNVWLRGVSVPHHPPPHPPHRGRSGKRRAQPEGDLADDHDRRRDDAPRGDRERQERHREQQRP
jgi:hypothetical protein